MLFFEREEKTCNFSKRLISLKMLISEKCEIKNHDIAFFLLYFRIFWLIWCWQVRIKTYLCCWEQSILHNQFFHIISLGETSNIDNKENIKTRLGEVTTQRDAEATFSYAVKAGVLTQEEADRELQKFLSGDR